MLSKLLHTGLNRYSKDLMSFIQINRKCLSIYIKGNRKGYGLITQRNRKSLCFNIQIFRKGYGLIPRKQKMTIYDSYYIQINRKGPWSYNQRNRYCKVSYNQSCQRLFVRRNIQAYCQWCDNRNIIIVPILSPEKNKSALNLIPRQKDSANCVYTS